MIIPTMNDFNVTEPAYIPRDQFIDCMTGRVTSVDPHILHNVLSNSIQKSQHGWVVFNKTSQTFHVTSTTTNDE